MGIGTGDVPAGTSVVSGGVGGDAGANDAGGKDAGGKDADGNDAGGSDAAGSGGGELEVGV